MFIMTRNSIQLFVPYHWIMLLIIFPCNNNLNNHVLTCLVSYTDIIVCIPICIFIYNHFLSFIYAHNSNYFPCFLCKALGRVRITHSLAHTRLPSPAAFFPSFVLLSFSHTLSLSLSLGARSLSLNANTLFS
jgi:hypothetical protein